MAMSDQWRANVLGGILSVTTVVILLFAETPQGIAGAIPIWLSIVLGAAGIALVHFGWVGIAFEAVSEDTGFNAGAFGRYSLFVAAGGALLVFAVEGFAKLLLLAVLPVGFAFVSMEKGGR